MRRSGFTLLEILVVLAILGFGMGLIVEMTTASARHSVRVEEDTIVQLAMQNLMSSILAGNVAATVGVSSPIPDAPNWETTVELADGPIDNIVAIRITAQRYETQEVPSIADPTFMITTRIPDYEKRFVIKEWARRAEIKTRVVKTTALGEVTAVDGTGLTFEKDYESVYGSESGDLLGGALGTESDAPDPFAAIDQQIDASIGAGTPQTFGAEQNAARTSGYFGGGAIGGVANADAASLGATPGLGAASGLGATPALGGSAISDGQSDAFNAIEQASSVAETPQDQNNNDNNRNGGAANAGQFGGM